MGKGCPGSQGTGEWDRTVVQCWAGREQHRASPVLRRLQVGGEPAVLQHGEGDLPLQQWQPAAQHHRHGRLRLPHRYAAPLAWHCPAGRPLRLGLQTFPRHCQQQARVTEPGLWDLPWQHRGSQSLAISGGAALSAQPTLLRLLCTPQRLLAAWFCSSPASWPCSGIDRAGPALAKLPLLICLPLKQHVLLLIL